MNMMPGKLEDKLRLPGSYAHGDSKVDPDERVEAGKQMLKMGPPPSAQQVIRSIASGDATATKIVGDMLDRIEIAHKMTNAVVQCTPFNKDSGSRCIQNPLTKRAQCAAADADRLPKAKRGPLHGLPFSVKECFSLEGTDSTIGVGKLKSVGDSDCLAKTTKSALVKAMIAAGAIPVCKTNVPQTMYAWECGNPVYGKTSCPSSELFVPGGSSGGESALIGAGGSIVGLGSDIGGSCRIPAHMAGCSGIKPTKYRLPSVGGAPTALFAAQTALASVPGLLGRSAKDLATVLSGILTPDGIAGMRQDDPHMAPIPWNASEFNRSKKLTFGYYLDDGYMTATPACQRAVQDAVKALKAAGHTVVKFELDKLEVSVSEAILAFLALISSGTEHVADLMKDETQAPFLVKLIQLAKLAPMLPTAVRTSILPWVFRNITGAFYKADLLPNLGMKTTTAYYEALHTQKLFSATWAAQFDAQELDLVLCPVHALPTSPHDITGDFVNAASYCFLANFIDWTAGVVPMCRLNPEKDAATDAFWSNVHHTGDTATLGPMRTAYEAVINSKKLLPLGVQLIGKPYTEELVLCGMTALEELSEFSAAPFTFDN